LMGGLSSSEESGNYFVLAFGDSLTAGYYRWGSEFHPYSIKLEKLLEPHGKFQVFEFGESGEKTSAMEKRLPTLLSQKYRWVIILGGTNDLGIRSSDQIFSSISRLHSMVHKKGAKSLVLTIPHCLESPSVITQKREEINKRLREMVKSSDCMALVDLEYSIDPTKMTKEEIEELYDDQLHFTPKGYDKMAELIYETLTRWL